MATSWPEGNTELFLSIDQNGVMFWGEGYEKMIFFPNLNKVVPNVLVALITMLKHLHKCTF